jgi:hypothetical protein
MVELLEQLPDGVIEIGEREAGLMTQARENPPLDDLDGDLDFGFILNHQLRVVPISRQPAFGSFTLSIRSAALSMNWYSGGSTGVRIGSIFTMPTAS